MAREICGRPTRAGTPCQWEKGSCPPHEGAPRPAPGGAERRAPAARGQAERPARRPPALPRAVEARDLRGLAWWLIGALIDEQLEERRASVVNSVLRTLAALGPEELSEEEALYEVELRGLLMHGLEPRTPQEWEAAALRVSSQLLAAVSPPPPQEQVRTKPR